MSERSATLRDFIYLDEERLRSLSAQLFRGLPESVSQEKEHAVKASGGMEGGLPGLIKAKAVGDYMFTRSESETRSFHHHVYSLFEDQIVKEKMLIDIDNDFDFTKWTKEFFHDGQFIRIKGLVRLMDYEWCSKMLEALPKMMETIYFFAKRSYKTELDSGLITKQQYDEKVHDDKQQLNQIKEWKMERMTELIEELYGAVIRVKVLPSRTHTDNVLVGSGEADCFYDTAASLAQKYGYEVDAGWITVGQINMSSVSEVPFPIPIGNVVEDGFEQIVFGLNQIMRMASAPEFPAVSFTPISIYRLIN